MSPSAIPRRGQAVAWVRSGPGVRGISGGVRVERARCGLGGFPGKCARCPGTPSLSAGHVFPFLSYDPRLALCFVGSRRRQGVTGPFGHRVVSVAHPRAHSPCRRLLPLQTRPLRTFGSRVEMAGGSCHIPNVLLTCFL